MLVVDGLNLANNEIRQLYLYLDSIQSTEIVDGTIFNVNKSLLRDIALYPKKYNSIFSNINNLKVLSYLRDCNRLDSVPYKTEYCLIEQLDSYTLKEEKYRLSIKQFKEIIKNFQYEVNKKQEGLPKLRQICLNVISIPKGLYVLAYKKLYLDIKNMILRPSENIIICKEFDIDDEKRSIRQFIDEEDLILLEDFDDNCEKLKDIITEKNPYLKEGVDDRPYIIGIGMDVCLDLDYEYNGILEMYDNDNLTIPIKAFFGELTSKPIRRKDYPIKLLNEKINLNQLLAIHSALKYPLVYVQGPPGNGKTNTIINTIVSAFFNERTVLVSSYNNHPIDSVAEKLQNIYYRNKLMPFPIIRLGNNDKVKEAIQYIRKLYEETKGITVYENTLQRNKEEETNKTKLLTILLKKHEQKLDLMERKESLEKIISSSANMPFTIKLKLGQLNEINKKLRNLEDVKNEDALELIEYDELEFYKYLYYISAKYIKRLSEPKYEKLIKIIYLDDEEKQIRDFNKYLSDDENLQKFMKIFPIIATTNICAHKLGEPKPYFDMVIMDEASQCNTAISLVPIIRGSSLMLVGDPQQLKPVILLDIKSNMALKKKYSILSDYDYIENSVFQVFVTCDALSNAILLNYHYRCHPKIIAFNNKKYYKNKLVVKSKCSETQPLVFIDYKDNISVGKNTSYTEVKGIIDFAIKNKDKQIGVITPFVNQRKLIKESLKNKGVDNVTCGTVHAFQGDEKDVVLFSLAITSQTSQKTYDWLKCNSELINVATSRAADKLVLLSSKKEIERLHKGSDGDDLYELYQYIQSHGTSEVTGKTVESRALGIKPYSTEQR